MLYFKKIKTKNLGNTPDWKISMPCNTRLEDLNALHNLPPMKMRLTELASKYIEANMASNNKMLVPYVNEFLQHNSKFRPIAPSLFTTIKDSIATHTLGQANFI